MENVKDPIEAALAVKEKEDCFFLYFSNYSDRVWDGGQR